MRLMRMHANRESRVRPELFEARGLFRFLRVAALEDHHHALEAGVLRARDHLIQILRERLIREMAMTINHVAMVACRASTAFGSPIVLSNYLATTGDTEDRRFKPVSKRNFSSASPVSSVMESLLVRRTLKPAGRQPPRERRGSVPGEIVSADDLALVGQIWKADVGSEWGWVIDALFRLPTAGP